MRTENISVFGFVKSIYGTVNDNDAMAATRVWLESLISDQNIPADIETSIYQTDAEIESAVRESRIDLFYIDIRNFWNLQDIIAEDVVLLPVKDDSIFEEYVLLVQKKSAISGIADLQGASLNILQSGRMSLADVWLDTLMKKHHLESASGYFGKIKKSDKLNDTILPVFFGKVDSCLVTRSGFEIIAELNPQISHQMKIIEVSSLYVPSLLCFRKAYEAPQLKEKILVNLETWLHAPAGQQLLMIFQIDDLRADTANALNGTVSFLKEYRQLFGKKL